MGTAAPFLASATKRLGAALVDAAPILLFAIFALALFDKLGLGQGPMLGGAPLIFVAYHAYFNYRWAGETPGRRLFDIRLVSSRSSGDLTIGQCIVRPVARLIWLLSFVPVAGTLQNPWYSVLPAFIDLFLVSSLPWRQTVADFLCRTIVVRTPPPQPHRAPAAPMYSTTDAEFGVAPRHIK